MDGVECFFAIVTGVFFLFDFGIVRPIHGLGEGRTCIRAQIKKVARVGIVQQMLVRVATRSLARTSRRPILRHASAVSSARTSTNSSGSSGGGSQSTTPIAALALATILSGALGYGLGAYSDPSSTAAKTVSKYGTASEVARAIEELRLAIPEEGAVTTDRHVLSTYGSSSNSYHGSHPHSVVVHAHSTEDVVKVVDIARKWKVPITPFSGGTSLEGHFAGVCISFFFLLGT